MKIIQLDLKFMYNEIEMVIHPTVIQDDHETILVDCGYPGMLPLLEEELNNKGISPESLTKVLITHHDDDHMGALYELIEKYPNIQVIASDMEQDYISGQKKSLRLIQAEEMLQYLPESEKDFGLAFIDRLKNIKNVPVDLVVTDGDTLEWAGGCTILSTPGHTPGHISIYNQKLDTVITGDAAVIEDNTLKVANPNFALNLADAEKSLNKLINLNARKYYCYHGGLYVNEHFE
ncbi:MBL fold metallo-hydrolase [Paenibacillus sp. KQZ6P-2]|uniref:MBL fold metallo-hydrolase n=1 Tax=Paenibacillus mangrovi TaxID=2931978 RepID=A0A9X2B1G0_9BACL|nr:MBL fold metallo-hydrolase [Paenibacillus mangrovi]MCJ8011489.1 MBL fold metallo-hydrolase [Paenibacillus mangrovi]